VRLAAVVVLLTVLGASACHTSTPEPVGTDSGGDPSMADVLISPPDPNAKSTKGEQRTGPPPTRWAMWPIPNFPSSGLPNPESYDLSVAGTVLDRVTGLMWQRAVDPGNMTFADATAKCDRLELGEYRDWRLPSRIELVSILDLAEVQPAIERSAFPATPSEWFWSSSVASDSPTAAWYVYFYFGYPKTDERRSHFRARCVRTEKPPAFKGDPDAHYEIGSESVHDLATGLTWQRALSPHALAFQDALAYCGHLSLDGHKEWRLPSMPELLSLVDERASNPAIDGAAFPGTLAESFWTSSRFGNKGAEAWHVSFDHGSALYGLLKTTFRIRCVH
jgi:hypothetical protein